MPAAHNASFAATTIAMTIVLLGHRRRRGSKDHARCRICSFEAFRACSACPRCGGTPATAMAAAVAMCRRWALPLLGPPTGITPPTPNADAKAGREVCCRSCTFKHLASCTVCPRCGAAPPPKPYAKDVGPLGACAKGVLPAIQTSDPVVVRCRACTFQHFPSCSVCPRCGTVNDLALAGALMGPPLRNGEAWTPQIVSDVLNEIKSYIDYAAESPLSYGRA